MKSTSPGHQRRQHGGEVARVLDRRPARHPQGADALVRDDHRQRGLAESGRAGQQDVVGGAVLHGGGLEQQLELPADLALPDELVERLRPERALERELGLRTRGVGGGRSRRVIGRHPCGREACPSAAAEQRLRHRCCSTSGVVRDGVVDRAARRVSRQPRPTRAMTTSSVAGSAIAAAAPVVVGCLERGELAGERQTTMSLAVFGPMPETLRNAASSSWATACAIWAGVSCREHAERRLRADAGDARGAGRRREFVASIEAEERERRLPGRSGPCGRMTS